MTMYGVVNACNGVIGMQSVINSNSAQAAVNMTDFMKDTFNDLMTKAEVMANLLEVMKYVQIASIGLACFGVAGVAVTAAIPAGISAVAQTLTSAISAGMNILNMGISTTTGVVQVGQGLTQGAYDMNNAKVKSYTGTQQNLTQTMQDTNNAQGSVANKIAESISSNASACVARGRS